MHRDEHPVYGLIRFISAWALKPPAKIIIESKSFTSSTNIILPDSRI